MIHDGRYKLIYYPCGNLTQLFDIDSDPREEHDLAANAEYSAQYNFWGQRGLHMPPINFSDFPGE
jgi:arylsulfatase A-like enzyme